jgi:hypothetical protein
MMDSFINIYLNVPMVFSNHVYCVYYRMYLLTSAHTVFFICIGIASSAGARGEQMGDLSRAPRLLKNPCDFKLSSQYRETH